MFSDLKKTRDENLFFNGVYQVVKVDSKFDQGQFTQTLTCVRMNNQQGEGAPPNVIASSALKSKYIVEESEEDKKKREKLKENIANNKELVKDLVSGKFKAF